MKKIVALVLSLVMVLGLATVAMADTTTTTLKADDGYAIYAVNGTTDLYEDKNITKTVTSNMVVSDGTTTTTTYYANSYVVDGVSYYEVDASLATYKLVNGTSVVAYLRDGTAPNAVKVVDSYVAAVANPDCGEFDKATYADGVYMIGDKAYAVTLGGTWAVLNGKFVQYGNVAVPKLHDYEIASYNSTDATPATLKCADCDKVFAVLSADAVKTMAPAAYTVATVGNTDYFVATGAVSAPVVDGDKVESAETFDAGIAMYVGMSVMAAAGSAVVLKKKD